MRTVPNKICRGRCSLGLLPGTEFLYDREAKVCLTIFLKKCFAISEMRMYICTRFKKANEQDLNPAVVGVL